MESTIFAGATLWIVLIYAALSSSMLLLNKFAVTYFPYSSTLTLVQCLFSVGAIVAAGFGGLLKYDPLTYRKVKLFVVYAGLFALSLFLNNRALIKSNVETVIVFRSATPLVVSMMEWLFLGRALPNYRSMGALVVLIIGVLGYVLTDAQFIVEGVSALVCVFCYMLTMCAIMTYGKHLMDAANFESPIWGSVYYCNTVSIPFVLACGYLDGEFSRIPSPLVALSTLEYFGILMLILSSIVGLWIGFMTWTVRAVLSAASFTLIGVVCKIATVIANVLAWGKHANTSGILFLLLGLAAASMYEQAPLRDAVDIEKAAITHELMKQDDGSEDEV